MTRRPFVSFNSETDEAAADARREQRRETAQRVSAGIGADDDLAPDQKRLRRVAGGWRYDPEMERLAANPELIDALPLAAQGKYHTALGYYDAGKSAAAALGRDVSGPQGGSR